jgi:hypothetical protein
VTKPKVGIFSSDHILGTNDNPHHRITLGQVW